MTATAPYERLRHLDPLALIGQYPIRHPTEGRTWLWYRLYRTAHRPGGRRIVVVNATGGVEYDTLDCASDDAATAVLHGWLTERVRAMEAELALTN